MTHADILALEGLEPCPHHETRPCPFCGGDAYLVRRLVPGREEWKDDPDGEAWRYWAVCRSCAAEGPWCKSGALGAAQRWNRRKRSASAKMEDYGNWLKAEVTVRELRAEVERLREALRWRTVAADGLPEAGVRVLVDINLGPVKCRALRGGCWWDADGRDTVRPGDRWLPVPEETP